MREVVVGITGNELVARLDAGSPRIMVFGDGERPSTASSIIGHAFSETRGSKQAKELCWVVNDDQSSLFARTDDGLVALWAGDAGYAAADPSTPGARHRLHMVRDRLTFVSLLSVTIGYVIVFGYAINPDPRHIPTIVVDHDKSEFSRLYKAALQQSVYLEIDQRQLTSDQASEMLRKAQTSVVIEIPPDFSRKLMTGLPAQMLELEITESVILADSDQTLMTLHRLRDIGISIAQAVEYRLGRSQ